MIANRLCSERTNGESTLILCMCGSSQRIDFVSLSLMASGVVGSVCAASFTRWLAGRHSIIAMCRTRTDDIRLLWSAACAIVFALLLKYPQPCASLWCELGVVARFVVSLKLKGGKGTHGIKTNIRVRIRRERVRCRNRWCKATWPVRLRWHGRNVVALYFRKSTKPRCTTRAGLCLLQMVLELVAYRVSACCSMMFLFASSALVHWYVVGLCYDFDSTLGFPGEGPQNEVCLFACFVIHLITGGRMWTHSPCITLSQARHWRGGLCTITCQRAGNVTVDIDIASART